MKKAIFLSIGLASLLFATEDLGVISVDSSTIDDKFKSTLSDISSTAIVDSNEIEKINPQNIVEVLNSVPGITAMQTEGDIVKLHIRGVDNQVYMGERPGVAVVIDGVPVQETTGKINIDLENIETIKVIKGGASYLYGNDAIAGAIVITTKRPKGENSSKVETEFGSFGYQKYLASTNRSFENSALQIQGSYKTTNGYWDRAFNDNKSFSSKYNYYIDDTSDIIFGLSYNKIDSGDGSGVHGVTAATIDPKSAREITYSSDYDTTLIKTFLTYSKDFEDNSNLMVSTYRYLDDKSYQSGYEDANGDGLDESHDYANDEKWTQNGIKSEYRFSFEKSAFMAGADIQRNKQESSSTPLHAGLTYSAVDTNEDVNAIYGEFKYKITDNLTSTLNARYDNIKYDLKNLTKPASSIKSTYDEGSYRAGLNYKINSNTNLYTSISTGFRAPTADQISSNSADGYTTDIKSESVYNYEIGVKGSLGFVNYDASIYQLNRDDYIGKSAGNYVRRSDEANYYDNVADMVSRGFELALSGDLSKDLGFNLAYTYLDAYFTRYSFKQYVSVGNYNTLDLSNNQVPRTPKHTINLRFDYKVGANLTLSPEIIAKSSYYADETNYYKQGGYALVNLRTSYKVNKNLELFGRVDNLLDRDYYQFVQLTNSSVSYTMEDATIIVGPSRSFYVGLRYKF
ncbi:TonB-dependent receptor [Halarcobacter ebronensis]|uniref:TonB-dependent receptor n=1 Tax=Halarcobacter ebronensis TaxID=1462615 RepID=A0A4Q1AK82_9BACT|nr:TonB-dependent receptor [Halarcobacter ebronensis]QKF83245.1 TonB-dependent receptor [Halarcobacter ebronensis]RXK05120.1 TonB-dependent receptor [Halarcobacter ebronensis]